ncbi:hypothetical protein F2P79_012051 [Pimephales promelas]|nr:hypothetical protein F2P79_012051 [Pimephales promelas]
MRPVFLGLFLCAVLPLVNAGCSIMAHNKEDKFCRDSTDKTWHPVGSTWRNSKCMDCNCVDDSMRCCDAMGTPIYPDKCSVEYNYDSCTYEVFEKVPCAHGAVGK